MRCNLARDRSAALVGRLSVCDFAHVMSRPRKAADGVGRTTATTGADALILVDAAQMQPVAQSLAHNEQVMKEDPHRNGQSCYHNSTVTTTTPTTTTTLSVSFSMRRERELMRPNNKGPSEQWNWFCAQCCHIVLLRRCARVVYRLSYWARPRLRS